MKVGDAECLLRTTRTISTSRKQSFLRSRIYHRSVRNGSSVGSLKASAWLLWLLDQLRQHSPIRPLPSPLPSKARPQEQAVQETSKRSSPLRNRRVIRSLRQRLPTI